MGIGPKETNTRGDALIEMETHIIVRESNYWGAGETLEEAKANYRKASGRSPSAGAVISEFEGTSEDIEKILIDDIDGTIRYPKTVTKK